ncbi:hypothetical protein [Mangrovimonas aestuarii]|uniref:hypothetical protein n=1 Tax=Mangrovimonas aestuarii TaxID=3018443 RepID=UPI002378CFA7|nr:hypothetical protein [Mangrovimonas aestuarii]
MKTIVLISAFILSSYMGTAQNNQDLALNLDEGVVLTTSKIETSKSGKPFFFSSKANEGISNRVIDLYGEVKDFDVAIVEGFNSKEPAKYQASFSNSYGRIDASYDSEGNLTSAKGEFKGIKIPSKIRNRIAVKYLGWTFESYTYKFKYNNSDGLDEIHKVLITKGKQSKWIRLRE